ncbi:hypothetical protein [Pseudomonas putida]|nr:hypothetical protein [Pseudomonas putida]
MARSAAIIERLKAEQAENPKVPHYDCKPDMSCWPLQPADVKTAGYWKREGRRVPHGAEPVAFVVSGQGSSFHGIKLLTRWMPAYHESQTVPVKSGGKAGRGAE